MCRFAVAALGYNCIFIFVVTDPNFAQLLQYRFQHPTPSPGCIEDVYDGLVYCSYSDFFQSKFNVSFALNYDGAPKFKSSGLQVWPIQLCLNELPPHVRYMVIDFIQPELADFFYCKCVYCFIGVPENTFS